MDELLVQYDTNRRATWPLQDAGGDVIALCDLAGVNASARMLTQIVYDAYGRVIGRDDPHNPATPSTGPPELRVGHKGLFFDRLDAGIFDVTLGRETPRLAPGARLSGYARNRTLHCDFGRWNQPDPNATGLPVQTAIAFHGEAPGAWVQSFDLGSHFGDGPNVREYVGGNAYAKWDPTGLFEFSIIGLLGGSTSAAGLQQEWGEQVLDAGMSMSGSLDAMFTSAALEQQDDLLWALDWRQDDDDYSRRGDFTSRANPSTAGNGHAMAGIKHHLMTNKNWKKGSRWSKEFSSLLNQHGIKGKNFLNSDANTMMLTTAREIKAHKKGPGHSEKYHKLVMKTVLNNLRGKHGADAREALAKALDEVRDIIRRKPEILHAR